MIDKKVLLALAKQMRDVAEELPAFTGRHAGSSTAPTINMPAGSPVATPLNDIRANLSIVAQQIQTYLDEHP
jgi:hypothetical protein